MAAAVDRTIHIAEVDRTTFGAEERDDLPQCKVQDFVEVERLCRHDRHRVERVQFPIAPLHLILSAALFGHVENESLIALHIARGIPGRETALYSEE